MFHMKKHKIIRNKQSAKQSANDNKNKRLNIPSFLCALVKDAINKHSVVYHITVNKSL